MTESEDSSSTLPSQVIYLVLLALFAASVFYYLYDASNDAASWEDFYSKQIAHYMDAGIDGQQVTLDVQPLIKAANGNDIDTTRPESIFTFDALSNQICIKAGKESGKCYPYFNDVAATGIEYTFSEDITLLKFRIESKMESETNE